MKVSVYIKKKGIPKNFSHFHRKRKNMRKKWQNMRKYAQTDENGKYAQNMRKYALKYAQNMR